MTTTQSPSGDIRLAPCPKAYTRDQDKAVSPARTLATVRERLSALPLSILARATRVDNGRLGIPVYLSVCGSDARAVMPTRKQMGKGASPEQAEASALMELMERYGFFTFWEALPGVIRAGWDEAEARFAGDLMPLEDIVKACHDAIAPDAARAIMNLREWLFFPALNLATQRLVMVPLDLFKQLGEFNGSSAGNTDVESLFQGLCELVERHVCCRADRERPPLPIIDPKSARRDPVLAELLDKGHGQGVQLVLLDFSFAMPVPTVGALAWDPSTFPDSSEIVFTAGTAASPTKAAVRALTEVAQLAGDFNSHACYEASGLPKFGSLDECAWLRQGKLVNLDSLPSLEQADMLDELLALVKGLRGMGFTPYAISTTNPDTRVPSHYSFVPGFQFRERDANASLGLFVGRMISEEADPDEAERALGVLENIYGQAHFLPFFRGMLALRQADPEAARHWFARAERVQPDNDSRALAAFYHAYTHTLDGEWTQALPGLDRAVALCPDMKEYLNLRGVCLFRLGRFAEAARDFEDILTRLDKGSVMDIQNLGLCYKRLGNAERARHYLTAALAIDPGLERARQELDEL
jgi:ribosomal protein S12 methylthiotransferase accessory factor